MKPNKTCPYCATKVSEEKEKFYCDFCDIFLKIDQVSSDGVRVQVPRHRSKVDPEELKKTTSELMLYPTWELILLLKEARKNRTFFYKKLYDVRKSNRGLADKQKGDEILAAYKDATKRMYVVENLIKVRIGYIPDNLNDSYMKDYEKRMNNKKTNSVMEMWDESDGSGSRRQVDFRE
ncbi:hypothetical protein M3573_18905 [Bacillus safensis]|uniref:hypothetical protein n=1 Tax=Bacillus safensis TaxID=561879 RepID=UPI00203B672F|nr:hypothetical protein [Bacillus safensis]MCM3140348.1 hypothetical protein [Bacillus safensis]